MAGLGTEFFKIFEKSAEAGGPRRFDPWVRGVWLVNRRVTHPLPPLRGRGGGGDHRGERAEGADRRRSWADDGGVAGRRGDQSTALAALQVSECFVSDGVFMQLVNSRAVSGIREN